ncbi:MAG TPA: FAD-binding oxidoreductase [Candidatus Cryosericum sp.]|nr:FAD-binding oxidoreductase [Candidatus Cryosericum sp.]
MFLRTAAVGGAAVAWFGGAHVRLKDHRWTPNQSFWVAGGRPAPSPPLRGERRADLAIIGGGVTGLSAALHALQRSPGLGVTLIEAKDVGFGATGRSGGVLGDGTEMGTPPGTEDNVALVEDLVGRHGIDCGLEREPAAQLDPYRYAVGLRRAAERLGASVFEGTRAISIEDGDPVVVRGGDFTLSAARVVVATNGYTPRLGIAADRIFPVHTAAAVTAKVPPEILRRVPDEIHVMTSGEMYMWGRKAPGGRVLVGAGASYCYDNGLFYRGGPTLFPILRRKLLAAYPFLAPYPFEHAWSGPMGCTADQEPIIGSVSGAGRILYGGAYSGHGIAMGTKMGLFLAGLLHGDSPPAWLLRPTLPLPGEPLRYVGVNSIINLMNLGLYTMAKRD